MHNTIDKGDIVIVKGVSYLAKVVDKIYGEGTEHHTIMPEINLINISNENDIIEITILKPINNGN